MARRKSLLSIAVLDEGNDLLDLGVPMTVVHKKLKLHKLWSYQSTVNIFSADRDGLHSVTRPDWLRKRESTQTLQEAPKEWTFEGTFPYGEWIYNGS